MMRRKLRALGIGALSATLLATGVARAAPWFGQVLPPPVNDPTKPVLPVKDDLPPQPATFGPGPKSPLLAGERIKADVVTIVGFSLESRAAGDYLWGRMSGAPAYYKTGRKDSPTPISRISRPASRRLYRARLAYWATHPSARDHGTSCCSQRSSRDADRSMAS